MCVSSHVKNSFLELWKLLAKAMKRDSVWSVERTHVGKSELSNQKGDVIPMIGLELQLIVRSLRTSFLFLHT